MADYEFYVNYYLGSAIPEKAFSGLAAQAEQYLQRLKGAYRVESSGEEAEKLAICAMAEELWDRRHDKVTSATVGSVSVRYEQDKASLRRELYRKASIYLDIYRGAGW